jgi:hypothetical protein
MPPAVLAVGAAAATIGGAALSASAQKKAAKQAAASQQQATDSQLQLGRENINFQQGIYNQNKALLTPFVDRGNVAGQSINALLGLGGTAPGTAEAPATSAPQDFRAGLPSRNDWASGALSAIGDSSSGDPIGTLKADLGHLNPQQQQAWSGYLAGHPDPDTVYEERQRNAAQTAPVAAQQPVSAPDATTAFNNFANSAGMQFQLQQGSNALNNLYAGHGSLQSGAAAKALQNYGQQTALNNYFLPYLNLLGGQQAVGAQSGSAIAGVGSNFGNTVSNIYGQQSNAIQSGADAASNAALLRGQANSNLYSGIASGLGGLASSFAPVGSQGSILARRYGGY